MNWEEFRQGSRQRSRPLIIAHRGAPNRAPENSLASFRLALEQGADVLETDLRMTRDGHIVLFHDADLGRMTGSAGPLFARTLAEVKQLHLRLPGGGWSEERIPTLIELLAMTQGRTLLLLELKDWRFARPEIAAHLVEILAAYKVLAKCAILAFNASLTEAVHTAWAGLPRGYLTVADGRPRAGMELLGPFWPLLVLNPAYVLLAHRMGCMVAPLDPAPEPRLRLYLRLGVDALLADDTARVRAALEQLGVA
jgi:glycerophosphoryl diester phosphodiesterase